MRHILALSAVLVLAGVCLGAEFKSDEAKKAQADYVATLEAAKIAYGQGLAKAKAIINAKAAAATDAISKEAIQSESAAITEELVRLRDADTAAFEPREWKSAETKKVKAAYAAELKVAQLKYGQDLTKARQAVLARKAADSDSAAKDALQKEADAIFAEVKAVQEELKGPISKVPISAKEIVIEALIDANSELYITSTGIYWKNIGGEKPGFWQEKPAPTRKLEPTWVNGHGWIPEWPDGPDGKSSNISKLLPLNIGKLDFQFEVVAVGSQRGQPGIAKQAGKVELKSDGAAQVLSIRDPGYGARWYRVRLFR